ncbi:hypothetical protein J2T17_007144 [Paenibacillus mucilaginosus]|uniref:hypothetical protein n=1 Tax=Paenibacillus mucilaginosus TaxID=61624 RepID=UPI003D21830B
MHNEQAVIVPTMESLIELVDHFENYIIDTELNPEEEFGVLRKDEKSGFTCMMTPDLSLFSIDILNAKDEVLIKILKEILDQYNIETERLNEDVQVCYKERVIEMQRHYERYWVTYRYNEEDGMILMRYRAFVNE